MQPRGSALTRPPQTATCGRTRSASGAAAGAGGGAAGTAGTWTTAERVQPATRRRSCPRMPVVRSAPASSAFRRPGDARAGKPSVDQRRDARHLRGRHRGAARVGVAAGPRAEDASPRRREVHAHRPVVRKAGQRVAVGRSQRRTRCWRGRSYTDNAELTSLLSPSFPAATTNSVSGRLRSVSYSVKREAGRAEARVHDRRPVRALHTQ